MATGDVDQNTLGATQADFIQQRVGDGLFGGLDGAILAVSLAGPHHRLAHFIHDGAHIGEIKVDQTGANHQVGHALDALVENIIGHAEGFGEGGFFIGQTEQVLVGDDDQRINHLLQRLNALFGLTHAFCALELERLGDNTDGQNAKFAGGLCDDRCGAGSGAAAHASGDKAHMRPRQMINDLFNALFSSSGADRGPRAGAKTFGDFHAKLNAAVRIALTQGLCVGICHHEINPVELLFDHVVDRVATGPTNTENGDPGLKVVMSGHSEVQCHCSVRLLLRPHSRAVFPPIQHHS